MGIEKEAWVRILADEDKSPSVDDIMNLLFTRGPTHYTKPLPSPLDTRPHLQYYRVPTSGLTIEQVAQNYAEDSMKLYDVDWARGEYHTMVPLRELREIREFDRGGAGANPDSAETIDRLEQKIKNEGFTIPVHVTVYASGKEPLLTEGNHRLVAAERLGLKEIPVVFFFR